MVLFLLPFLAGTAVNKGKFAAAFVMTLGIVWTRGQLHEMRKNNTFQISSKRVMEGHHPKMWKVVFSVAQNPPHFWKVLHVFT